MPSWFTKNNTNFQEVKIGASWDDGNYTWNSIIASWNDTLSAGINWFTRLLTNWKT